MQTCPECGTNLPEEEVESCPACGSDLRTRECPHCGEETAATAEACPACGQLLVPASCSLHPDRAALGTCVVCGTAVCEECNRAAPRKVYLCARHQEVEVIDGWAEVYSTFDEVEAGLIRENLQAEGFDAQVLSQKDQSVFPVDLGDLAVVRVLVPAFQYTEARALLEAHEDAEGEVEFGDGSEGFADEADAEPPADARPGSYPGSSPAPPRAPGEAG